MFTVPIGPLFIYLGRGSHRVERRDSQPAVRVQSHSFYLSSSSESDKALVRPTSGYSQATRSTRPSSFGTCID